MKKNPKFIFKINIFKDFVISIKIIKVDFRIFFYHKTTLFKSENNFPFIKGEYFYISKTSCVLPEKIIGEYDALYSDRIHFNTEEELKFFLTTFKNDLNDFSKSDLFKKNPFVDDETEREDRIAFKDDYWIVY